MRHTPNKSIISLRTIVRRHMWFYRSYRVRVRLAEHVALPHQPQFAGTVRPLLLISMASAAMRCSRAAVTCLVESKCVCVCVADSSQLERVRATFTPLACARARVDCINLIRVRQACTRAYYRKHTLRSGAHTHAARFAGTSVFTCARTPV